MQRAPADHSAEIKIAVGRVVHAVGQDAALDRTLINGGVDFGGVGCRNHHKVAIEVGEFKCALRPFEPAIGGEGANLRCCNRGNDAQMQAGIEQAANLLQRNIACADDEAVATVQFEKDWQQAHGILLNRRLRGARAQKANRARRRRSPRLRDVREARRSSGG